VITASVKILREYERAVVFTLGRFQKVKGPGLVLLIPFVQEMVRVDLRIQVIEIPTQDVISRDNVSMKVDAVLYFNVVNPERAIIQVQNYLPATNMLAQTTLRAVLGSMSSTRCCPNERSSAPTSRAFWTRRPKPGGSR
jgi:regulator of protease activity HflC (stomatin/prohibitin superfamily)